MFDLVDANSFYASCERVSRPQLAGKPVVVLSNNDGCIIARSKEAKAIGLEMGEPYFKCRDKLRAHGVAVFSSNYTLYDDMSRRVQDVLRPLADAMEVYSIDESFLWWSGDLPWQEFGEQIKEQVLQWTGLPVGVGFGPTKTLAKLANHLSKRGRQANGVHVLDTESAASDALAEVELGDIWGISRGFVRRLAEMGITKPLQLRGADPAQVRTSMGVVGQRIVHELRGTSCIDLETDSPDKQNICCSRSFGKVTSELACMREAVSTFAAQAASKMRRQDLASGKVGVFVQTDRHAPVPQYAASLAVRLAAPSCDSSALCKAAAWCLSKVLRPEHQYKKAGVMLFDLGKRTGAQLGLYGPVDPDKSHRLMTTIDGINKLYGHGTIRLASTSPFTLSPCRTWHLRSDHRSSRYTTRWDELPVARAVAPP
ncbi:MAG TPA: Y-family DNA polymerase [Tepidisphaeraceae bacterium]